MKALEPQKSPEQAQADWRSAPEEPLLPIEKKLIGWSLVLGVVLLGVLLWISRTFFAVS